MSRDPRIFAAVVVPVALVSWVELAINVLNAGPARVWLARFEGGLCLAQIAAGLVLGSIFFALQRPAFLVRHPSAASLAATAALIVLHQLSQGFPPLLPAPRVPLAGALGAASIAALGAFLLTRLWEREEAWRATLVAIPSVLVLGGGLFRLLLISLGIPAGSRTGLAIGTAALALSSGAGVAARRLLLRRDSATRIGIVAAGLVPAAFAAAVIVSGRPLLSEPVPKTGGSPDLLLVVLDTAREDAVPASPGALASTPVVAGLISEGRVWTEAFSTSCWTLPAHVSLFTGLDAESHGVGWTHQHLGPDRETLAARLAQAGWRTGGFSANPWVSPEFCLDRGFERFVTGDSSWAPKRPWLVRNFPRWFDRFDAPLIYEDKRGMQLVAEVLKFLAVDDARPTFVFLNLLEPHLSYNPPRRFRDRLASRGFSRAEIVGIDQESLRGLVPGSAPNERELSALRLLYEAEVGYADALLGRIVDRLRSVGRLDRTIVAVTSDHGENLGDHPPLDHQLGLWETLLRVPLILRFPESVPPGTSSDELVSLADVPNALYRLATDPAAGIPLEGLGRQFITASYDRPGPILDRIRSRLGIDPAVWDRSLAAIRTRERKWIVSSDGRSEAYDLGEDPHERINLAHGGAVPAGFEDLARELAKHLETAAGQTPAWTPESVINDETLRKLRSLGYVD